MTAESVVALIVILAVIGIILTIIIKISEQSDSNLEGYTSCEGFAGKLTDGETGCFTEKSCENIVKADGTTTKPEDDEKYYWQYVGEGRGCAKGQVCCAQVEKTGGYGIDDLKKETCTRSSTTIGKLYVVKNDYCISPEKDLAVLTPGTTYTLQYYPSQEAIDGKKQCRCNDKTVLCADIVTCHVTPETPTTPDEVKKVFYGVIGDPETKAARFKLQRTTGSAS